MGRGSGSGGFGGSQGFNNYGPQMIQESRPQQPEFHQVIPPNHKGMYILTLDLLYPLKQQIELALILLGPCYLWNGKHWDGHRPSNPVMTECASHSCTLCGTGSTTSGIIFIKIFCMKSRIACYICML